jgi:hypothetical protein
MGTVFAAVCIFLTRFANSSTLNGLRLALGPDATQNLSGQNKFVYKAAFPKLSIG